VKHNNPDSLPLYNSCGVSRRACCDHGRSIFSFVVPLGGAEQSPLCPWADLARVLRLRVYIQDIVILLLCFTSRLFCTIIFSANTPFILCNILYDTTISIAFLINVYVLLSPRSSRRGAVPRVHAREQRDAHTIQYYTE